MKGTPKRQDLGSPGIDVPIHVQVSLVDPEAKVELTKRRPFVNRSTSKRKTSKHMGTQSAAKDAEDCEHATLGTETTLLSVEEVLKIA